jgi:adenosylcobinamide-GDP ribazoletransferase
MVLYILVAVIGIWYLGGFYAVAATIIIASLVYWYYYTMAKREFGGLTGDLAGYFLQICELALLAGLALVSHLI